MHSKTKQFTSISAIAFSTVVCSVKQQQQWGNWCQKNIHSLDASPYGYYSLRLIFPEFLHLPQLYKTQTV